MLCSVVCFFSARLWRVPWPAVVLVGFFLCGLLVAGALMMLTVWSMQVMQLVVVSLVMPMVTVLQVMQRMMVPSVMLMVRVLQVM